MKYFQLSLLIFLLVFSSSIVAQQNGTVGDLVQQGQENYEKRNYKTAYDYFKKAMKIDPNHPEAMKWFWKMKKEHDVSKLSDIGPALTGPETAKNTHVEETVKKASVKIVYGDREEGAIQRREERAFRYRMKELDEKISKLHSALNAARGKETGMAPVASPEGIDLHSPLFISLVFISFIFLMIFLTVLIFYRSRIKRIPPAPQPTVTDADAIVRAVFDRLGFDGGRDKKLRALTMARRMLLESPKQADQLRGMITRFSLDNDEAVSRESRRLLDSLGGSAQGAGATEMSPGMISGELPGSIESYTEGYLLLLDAKYKWDHSRTVKMLAGEVGMRLGLTRSELKELQIAALLENAGFLRISDAVLNKKSQLSKDEMGQILMHPEYSADIALSMGLPERIVEAVRAHHERYNGSGYPLRKSGISIPLYARIIGVCDSYAALTSEKPFRAQKSIDEALDVLRRESFLFDPDILKVFIEVIDFIRLPESVMKNDLVMRG